MPTLLHVHNLRVVMYPNDHRPAHVHVIGNGSEAVFNLACPDGPPELRENYGFSQSVLSKVQTALELNLNLLCAKWRVIHGHY